MEFQSFVSWVNDLWGQPQFNGFDLEFDQPLRELGFHGVPHKSSVFIVPTSTCLIELVETPLLIVTLSEIEIINLERVGLGQKNFDMTIVFKDFKRDVPESESEDDDSDSESLVESDDEEEEDSEEGSGEEEGKTWEELEKGDDSKEERKRRKMKAVGKS
ncbi:putative FACT complex subunit SPT16 [Quillaja saponaria]|uniref:FACT complex subunit n=1 Tax=Quillaja saponaria TaxID=32244 RepID=A0AAD7PE36_QUISA|nr:putative FACT complex subunit SPT16 [Quillaja saponaria]